MGIGNIGIWQLLVVLLIVLLIFGSGKIKNLGKDLGGAFKGFRSAMNEVEEADREIRGSKNTDPGKTD
ncbi:twin-arginine translocase TatA/TatE family subunit [Wenzhouxiangella sp. AB-CW3]|uniref:twin-arginine translocase TatA/TatE family subunit n=1 Tax=Wenzhouxiangella sp. AB-CW3 TaxID=2771012 RepID=UPI00168AB0E8|nr:twin-arginine translocase TatA/TatE family subunit [Wenzhouxiangella sp. AB-CW3]QOC21921.1 twin-arginine translocase TatA/TatE family subunit [Wenzhouxiangella sp. AB-CW3]